MPEIDFFADAGEMDFDASKVAPMEERRIVTPGEYVVQIVKSQNRDSAKTEGARMLALEMEILSEGEFKGARLFENLNLKHPKPDTVSFAKRTLSSICRAAGVMQLKNSEQLHFIPMVAIVEVVPDSRTKDLKAGDPEKLPPQNRQKGYKPYVQAGALPQGQAQNPGWGAAGGGNVGGGNGMAVTGGGAPGASPAAFNAASAPQLPTGGAGGKPSPWK